MSHKVHPKSYRIKGIDDWNIRSFYGKRMSTQLQEDFLIKDFLQKKLTEAAVENIEIERSASKVIVIIKTARPGLIIGRGGQGVEELKKKLQREISRRLSHIKPEKKEIKIEIQEIKNPWTSAKLVAKMSAKQIERRLPFRRVIKKTIDRVMANREVKGIRMEMAGRLNGIEIARKEWLSQGKMPRNTIRADIDYGFEEAHCTYGKIGIKVWIYKGEKFEQ